MNYETITRAFAPFADENCLKIIETLRAHSLSAGAVAQFTGLKIDEVAVLLDTLCESGIVKRFDNGTFGISPFGAFGASEMLKSILGLNSGCRNQDK